MQLSDFFAPYKNIKKIDQINDDILSIKRELKRQIFDEFDASFSSQGLLTSGKTAITDGAVIIDILGAETKYSLSNFKRQQLIDWYCDLLLKDYRSIFHGNIEISGLENLSRRFSWLNRLIKNYEENHASIFPASWTMGEVLCEKFCIDTNKDVLETLSKGQFDTRTLIKALKETLAFETQLARKFQFELGGVICYFLL